MAKAKIYSNNDVAELCDCSFETVVKYAQKSENEISFLGTGIRKIYIWFDEDIERFKSRNTQRGRPKKPVQPLSP